MYEFAKWARERVGALQAEGRTGSGPGSGHFGDGRAVWLECGVQRETGGSGADSSPAYGSPEAPCLSLVRVKGTDDCESGGAGRGR